MSKSDYYTRIFNRIKEDVKTDLTKAGFNFDIDISDEDWLVATGVVNNYGHGYEWNTHDESEIRYMIGDYIINGLKIDESDRRKALIANAERFVKDKEWELEKAIDDDDDEIADRRNELDYAKSKLADLSK